jgi:hypothetical protein
MHVSSKVADFAANPTFRFRLVQSPTLKLLFRIAVYIFDIEHTGLATNNFFRRYGLVRCCSGLRFSVLPRSRFQEVYAYKTPSEHHSQPKIIVQVDLVNVYRCDMSACNLDINLCNASNSDNSMTSDWALNVENSALKNIS